MADITSPQAIEFANRRARPAADVLAQTYYTAKQVVDQWNALGGAAAIPNDTSRIMDGSVVDGRPTTPTADPLICFFDTGVTGFPVTPGGGNINVTVNASGVFAL